MAIKCMIERSCLNAWLRIENVCVWNRPRTLFGTMWIHLVRTLARRRTRIGLRLDTMYICNTNAHTHSIASLSSSSALRCATLSGCVLGVAGCGVPRADRWNRVRSRRRAKSRLPERHEHEVDSVFRNPPAATRRLDLGIHERKIELKWTIEQSKGVLDACCGFRPPEYENEGCRRQRTIGMNIRRNSGRILCRTNIVIDETMSWTQPLSSFDAGSVLQTMGWLFRERWRHLEQMLGSRNRHKVGYGHVDVSFALFFNCWDVLAVTISYFSVISLTNSIERMDHILFYSMRGFYSHLIEYNKLHLCVDYNELHLYVVSSIL